MTERNSFAVMLVVETGDPRLTDQMMVTAMRTAGGVARMRHAVLQHLPQDVTRLVAVFPVEQAQMLMQLHDAIGTQIAADRGADPPIARPPADYIPPARD